MASTASDVGEIARRYALALYGSAEAAGAVDAVADDLTAFRRMLASSADLKALVLGMGVRRSQSAGAAMAVAQAAKFHTLTTNVLGVCARNGRLAAIDMIAAAYLARVAQVRGEMEAKVTVARALTQAQEAALTDAVKQAVGTKATLKVDIDPSLLGGMIVKLGSKMFDSSLKTKLGRLQTAMKG